MNEEFQKEISLVLLVNHKNVVKLFGLCSETKMPLLVYEFISNGNYLFKNIHDRKLYLLASWGNRLRIASEITLALDYLLSLADPPIVHGDVKSESCQTEMSGKRRGRDTTVFISKATVRSSSTTTRKKKRRVVSLHRGKEELHRLHQQGHRSLFQHYHQEEKEEGCVSAQGKRRIAVAASTPPTIKVLY
ncbi:hypothetical protein POTOM_016190 [Populus tomentosa]|uniref:Protein kinase domain-containing protein n=1 Tax=Populus tomentosa TaxID=118781 RepID=A0A8X8A392_POPTO|nr:hypothetical protein POTOM_016190 [Populus tomentosa]